MSSKDVSPEDKYDIAETQLKSFTRSKVRTKIMLCLKDADMSAAELEKEIDVRNTTILHAIKDMSKSELVVRTDDGYGLTNLGKMQAYLLEDLINVALVMNEYQDFWLSHDITGIPPYLLQQIGMLGQSEIITANPAALLKAQENFMKELREAKEVRGVSPIIIPGYAEAITHPILNGLKVDLILTDDILKIVFEEYGSNMSKLLECNNFKLYRIDTGVSVAFTVTDSVFSLGLFRLDGGYDLGNDLICTGDDAVKWGQELFEHYRERAELIDIGTFI